MTTSNIDTEPSFLITEDLASQLGTIQPDSITSRTLFRRGRVKAVLFGFAAGQELSEHTSTRRAVLQFVSGRAEVTLGAERVHAGAGTLIEMEPNLSHSVSALTDVVMLLLMIDES
jgi:quercetin dioxygenase-like cupin family protein